MIREVDMKWMGLDVHARVDVRPATWEEPGSEEIESLEVSLGNSDLDESLVDYFRDALESAILLELHS